jgi:feruloyl esterase
MKGVLSALFVLISLPAFAQAPAVQPASCDRLAASLSLPHATVVSTRALAGGRFTPPSGATIANLPPFCRVAITLTPSADSDIKSEVWMPLSGWNGKYLQVGNGAWGGSINYEALADGVRRGYAAASTDTGHTGTDASFSLGHPEKLVDFGYRAVHETAVQGNAATAALYGTKPRLSYFNGCSGGGRQAFMEAQRFPDDFDGIIASAPGYNRTDIAFQTLGMAQATHASAASFIPVSKLPFIHQAALNACDAADGLKDNLISDPVKCDFDPGVLACTGADRASCLTPAQVTAARKIYAPVVDPKTRTRLAHGLEPGSELHWDSVAGARPHDMYHDLMRFVVFEDPNWDFRTLNVANHLELARARDNNVLAATSTDLTSFTARGGKLIMVHGWEDQNIPPLGSVDYYNKLVATIGKERVDAAVRLYMVPGYGHCGGGDGPNQFDMLAALERWREQGAAPTEVLASKVEGEAVSRTRPLCPYPAVARYNGTGSIDRAESFACSMPAAARQDRFFDSDGVKIRHVDEGQGEPVILVHGFTGDLDGGWIATGVLPELVKDYRVVAFDLRGHGKSDKPSDPRAYGREMVLDIVRLMDHLQIRRAHIVGYALGANVVAKLLVMHPDRFITATIGGAGGRQPFTPEEFKAAEDEAKQFEQLREKARPGLGPLNDPLALAAIDRSKSEHSVTDQELKAVRVPVLTIAGSLDGSLPAVKHLGDVVSNARVVVIDGAVHATADPRGAPRRPEFVAAMRAFLASHAAVATVTPR